MGHFSLNHQETKYIAKGMLLILTLLLTLTHCKDPASNSEPTYELVWSDEFDGDSIDRDTWNFWIGPAYNYELQYYTNREKNVFIENNMLHLQAHRERYHGYNYTSARISTDSTRIGWMQGRFEARMKMPEGKGFWPAFWLMPMNEIGWPKGGEIDIMEYRSNEPYTTTGAVHYWLDGCDGTTPQCMDYFAASYSVQNGSLSEDFHIYALEWNLEELVWYLDDTPFQRIRLDEMNAGYDPFSSPFYIILNLAVGGTFVDNPDQNTPFPQSLIIDYVRVYQLTN